MPKSPTNGAVPGEGPAPGNKTALPTWRQMEERIPLTNDTHKSCTPGRLDQILASGVPFQHEKLYH